MLRAAAQGKGFFHLGTVTRAEADALGKAWVGVGYTTSQDGKVFISANGLRQYRPPTYKIKQRVIRANLEWRREPSGVWPNNGHLDIVKPEE